MLVSVTVGGVELVNVIGIDVVLVFVVLGVVDMVGVLVSEVEVGVLDVEVVIVDLVGVVVL